MFKLSFKRGQTSLELFILMLVVMLGAAVVATEMSKVSFESNTTTDIKYTTLGAFATGGSFVYNDHSGKNTGGYDKDNEKDLEDLLKNETKDKDKDGDKDVYELGEGSLYIELVGVCHYHYLYPHYGCLCHHLFLYLYHHSQYPYYSRLYHLLYHLTEDKNNDEKDKSSNKEYLYNANGTFQDTLN